MQDIAKAISRGLEAPASAAERHEQIRRLFASLKVAEKWMEAAREDASVLFNQAEFTRDKIEDELARACFEAEVADRRRVYMAMADADSDLRPVAEMRVDAIHDALVEAFCVLRDAPADLFPEARPRARHEVMGALMAALDLLGGEEEPEKQTA